MGFPHTLTRALALVRLLALARELGEEELVAPPLLELRLRLRLLEHELAPAHLVRVRISVRFRVRVFGLGC